MSRLTEIKAQLEAAYPHEITPASGLELVAALEAVEALHYADEATEGTFPEACVEGPCEHPEDCPEVSITPCHECSTRGEYYIQWPCPTIRAITEALQ